MINAWSLLYDELYGDDEMTDKTYPVENNELNDENIVINTGTGNTIFNVPEDLEIDEDIPEVVTVGGADEGVLNIDGGDTLDFGDFVNFDMGIGNTAYTAGFDTLNIDTSGYPSAFTALSDNDDAIAHLIDLSLIHI